MSVLVNLISTFLSRSLALSISPAMLRLYDSILALSLYSIDRFVAGITHNTLFLFFPFVFVIRIVTR
jgi:hypothetical protein